MSTSPARHLVALALLLAACSKHPRTPSPARDAAPPAPTPIAFDPNDRRIVEIATTSIAGCARRANGTVWCWGNYSGGVDIRSGAMPVALGITDVVELAGGWGHFCARTADGGVSCWGSQGIRGSATPTRVAGVARAVGLALGADHSCALIQGGTVTCWDDGPPAPVPGLTGATAIVHGNRFGCALLLDHTVRCWDQPFGTPAGLRGVERLYAALDFACARLPDAQYWCWGSEGMPAPDSRRWPVPTHLAELDGADDIGIKAWHGCAVRAGALACWGLNRAGQLGDGTTRDRQAMAPVPGLTHVISVVPAADFSCAVLDDGTAKCWGTGGQIGDGTTEQRLTPVALQVP